MSQLKFSRAFSDHAVLQRNTQAPIWGYAPAGAVVVVEFRLTFVSAVADASGQWCVRIPTRGAGGPFELTVRCGDDALTLTDILVGEVWLCSGQSNMEWPLAKSDGGPEELQAAASYPIRLFMQFKVGEAEPTREARGTWAVATEESAQPFSAVGWYFGRRLHAELNVPIGLIHSSWGGTPAEAWTPRESLASAERLKYLAARAWKKAEKVTAHVDPGVSSEASGWKARRLDESQWETMDLPRAWESVGLNIDGAVWFRRELQIPGSWAGRDLVLSLGIIDDFDDTFWNGERVGGMDVSSVAPWSTPRIYTVPGRLVEAGSNQIATRVFDQWAAGGFVGRREQMFVHPADAPEERIHLAGDWRYRVELALPPRQPDGSKPPASLYNGMIAPFVPYALAGFIWYQGESNADRAEEYHTLFPLMIQSWRDAWGWDVPFLFVLLANWGMHKHNLGYGSWGELREAQVAALALPNTACASAIDIGDSEDLHPRNKRDVGHRLALGALAVVYGQSVRWQGPTLESYQVTGGKARITLRFAEGLHACDGDGAANPAVKGFVVAGDDKVFHPAEAQIDGSAVVVECKAVPRIASVRYAWANDPDANLYNAQALPAQPFRTDDWPLVTRGAIG
jgi:sialate O-acetylesterase